MENESALYWYRFVVIQHMSEEGSSDYRLIFLSTVLFISVKPALAISTQGRWGVIEPLLIAH